MAKSNVAVMPTQPVVISPPQIEYAVLNLQGTAPLCTARFAAKAKLMAEMQTGKSARSKTKSPRDFDDDFRAACHKSAEGWYGISASAFRMAAISACRLAGFQMTRAKLSIFIEPDGDDEQDGAPLVRIRGNDPEMWVTHVRNATGVIDLRARPLWREWSIVLTVRYDSDQFRQADIVNLFARVGAQVGIGEGRPDSRSGAGLGYGLFKLVNADAG